MTNILNKLKTATLTGIVSLWLIQGVALGEGPWRDDFDEICAKTGEAMTLSVSELNLLIGRCEALKKVIETQEASVRKVYLKRLEMCSNLYVYMLQYKRTELPAQ